jgi:hypothetical protein
MPCFPTTNGRIHVTPKFSKNGCTFKKFIRLLQEKFSLVTFLFCSQKIYAEDGAALNLTYATHKTCTFNWIGARSGKANFSAGIRPMPLRIRGKWIAWIGYGNGAKT